MFAWPPSTLVDRIVPKTKIFENSSLGKKLRTLFSAQIREIRWLAKLAPETLRLSPTPQTGEIAVFCIALKGETVEDSLLDALDRVIAPPIFFILQQPDGRVACSAAFKRPNAADASHWVTGRRYRTAFQLPDRVPPPLPVAIDLGHLYASLLAPLLPLPARAGEPAPAWVDRCDHCTTLRRRLEQGAARLQREKQFNRKVELNRELNALRAELEALERP